jgi:RNA polymerase sigma factor (sigma-70 family)
MTPDAELLRRFAETRSEDAFAELVRRYVDLVYSAALRQVNGDTHLAQDVAQVVFADLARKAASLANRERLTGWLYTSVHFAAAKVVRSERRRRAREQEAHTMRELLHDPTADVEWNKLIPVLDAAMNELKEADREIILLRYFEDCRLAEVGAKFGLSENAARMRVERALEKLRTALANRGVTTTAAALATVVIANAVHAAPAGLSTTLVSTSVASAAAGGGVITFLKIMTATNLKLGVAGVLAVAGVATLVIQHHASADVREENLALRREVAGLKTERERLSGQLSRLKDAPAPRLPAPPLTASASAVPVEDAPQLSLYDRVKDISSKLTDAQLESYLRANRRNAASLLAAYRTSGDAALLEEAKQKFPNDSQVAFEAAFKKDASTDERRQWLETLKRSDPDNALPNYLSAIESFKTGQIDLAVKELTAAYGKGEFQDYTLERVQNDEEAFRAAGYPMAEAKTIPAQHLLLPQLAQMKDLIGSIVDLANSYRQAGDETSAQAALQIGANLGQRYSASAPGEAEISQLVGVAIERIALSKMDPNSPYGSNGETVQERLNHLSQQRDVLMQLNDQLNPLLPKLSDQDWISYKDRWRAFGEEAAVRWVIGKYGSE